MQPTLTERMGRGAAGGAVAGAAFAGLEAWNAISHDLPVRAPFLAISTILLGEDRVITGPSAQMVGLVIHLAISIFYGMAFGLVTPRLWTNGTVALAGPAYGVLIYLIDLQIIAPIWFPIFTTRDQSFELLVHVIYGMVVATAFYSSGARRGEPVISVGRPR